MPSWGIYLIQYKFDKFNRTPPKLRSITGIVSFPESNLKKSKKAQKVAVEKPVPRAPSASYPSIDDEILRYRAENQSKLDEVAITVAPAAEKKPEKIVSIDTVVEKKPKVGFKSNDSTMYELDFEEFVQDEVSFDKLQKSTSNTTIAIEAREKTPRQMVSMERLTTSTKGHPKTSKK